MTPLQKLNVRSKDLGLQLVALQLGYWDRLNHITVHIGYKAGEKIGLICDMAL